VYKAKLVFAVLANTLTIAVPLFAFAGTLDWWRAWVIVGLMFAGSVWSMLSLSRDLLEERLKPPVQKGQPALDRVILLLFLALFFGLLIVTPLDVFHLHLLPRPTPFVSSIGLILFCAGWWIAYLALRENAFAAPVVRHQEERHQSVVSSGVYSVVRHPMYAGGVLLLVGLPLWLESHAGAIFSLATVATVATRIILEESFLRRELPGYDDYVKRVRYRLVPFIW
jgi:protein-S-isoprenylcysteine O-methyltransferase Ste14